MTGRRQSEDPAADADSVADDLLVECLEDFEQRLRDGSGPRPEDYRARLGAGFERFLTLLRVEQAFDHSVEPTSLGPRVELRPVAPNRYSEFRKVGEGGMGVVYWAVDNDLNREVAFKVVRPPRPDRGTPAPPDPLVLACPPPHTPAKQAFEALRQRFLQEAWVTSGMAHPGIVPVYELGETPEGVPYYTMRFVKGEHTLASALDAARLLPVAERLPLLEPFLRVCDTIRYAHARGVVHRDLKPQNIALGAFGEVVVLDWGLAKLGEDEDPMGGLWQERVRAYRDTAELRTAASALGTPGYMSPEAARGALDVVDEQSDVYSLGVILFEILTGRLPYEFDDYDGFLAQLEAEPPRADAVDPAVPEGLAGICEQALAHDRTLRLSSVEVLADRIRSWQTQTERQREVERLLRDVHLALESARLAAPGEARLRQVERAVVALARVEQGEEGHEAAAPYRETLDTLRTQGLREREHLAKRRLLVRAGLVAVAFLAVAGFLVAGILERKRREAEEARTETSKALSEKSAALERVFRLADAKKVRDLLDEASLLWPLHPDRQADMADWIERAKRVLANRPDHEAALASLRRQALPETEEQRRKSGSVDLARREVIAERLAEIDRAAEALLGEDAFAKRRVLTEEAERLHEEQAQIDFRLRERRRFGTPEADWRHQVLLDLLASLSRISDPDDDGHGLLADVEQRHALVRELRKRSIEDHAESWQRTIEAIATSPTYGGLEISPQLGLVPLGPAPASGLFEFAHVGSGTVPTRDPTTGRLDLAEDAAVVLVLLPGGTFHMGAQNKDTQGVNYDPDAATTEGPVREVTLSPFLISKYELTQAQWTVMTGGEEPSHYRAGQVRHGYRLTRRHPVESVSWEACDRWLTRHRLALPSEAQWEYACRAGTDTPWSSGRESTKLATFANLGDLDDPDSIADGFDRHAPVGSFAPNAFGLHDVHGNVWEWCRDPFAPYEPGPRIDPVVQGPGHRTFRGGGWSSTPRFARSAIRNYLIPTFYLNVLGARPVCRLQLE